MTSTTVSVVIPSYNYSRFVRQAVDSVLTQTYPPSEIIVVDDGSCDNTRLVLEPYIDRIKYIYQENKGLPAARNTGIRAASGEWVALLDADDTWHPQKLELQLKAVSLAPDVGLIGSPDGANIREILAGEPIMEPLNTRDFLVSTRFGPSGALIRHSCFQQVGVFDESLRSVEDRDMWLRLSVHFPCLCVYPGCWWYREHLGQMNRNAQRMLDNYKIVLAKFFDNHRNHRHLRNIALGYMYYDSSWSYFEENRRRQALRSLLRSIWHRPFGLADRRIQTRFPRLKRIARYLVGKPC